LEINYGRENEGRERGIERESMKKKRKMKEIARVLQLVSKIIPIINK